LVYYAALKSGVPAEMLDISHRGGYAFELRPANQLPNSLAPAGPALAA
jgi:hypothetical protein